MTIETRCSDCGTILAIDDQYAGREARCTRCHNQYTVPETSDLESLDAVCHYCGVALPLGLQVSDSFKTCPDCQASIEENQWELAIEEQKQARHAKRMWLALGLIAAVIALLALADAFISSR